MKAATPLAKSLATASDRRSNKGPRQHLSKALGQNGITNVSAVLKWEVPRQRHVTRVWTAPAGTRDLQTEPVSLPKENRIVHILNIVTVFSLFCHYSVQNPDGGRRKDLPPALDRKCVVDSCIERLHNLRKLSFICVMIAKTCVMYVLFFNKIFHVHDCFSLTHVHVADSVLY